MSEIDSLAFQPGQQVECKTMFNDSFVGEVIAFDLKTKVLALKSGPTSTATANNNTFDIHFLVLDNVTGVEILKEPPPDFPENILPSIDIKITQDRIASAVDDRSKLTEAFRNGVSKDGLLLFAEFSKKYSRRDVSWRDKVKIVVLNQVVISPPYKESNCMSLNPKSLNDAVPYVKKIVSYFWESKSK